MITMSPKCRLLDIFSSPSTDGTLIADLTLKILRPREVDQRDHRFWVRGTYS